MRKLIAAINLTLDGFCDHTYGIADDELHDHYNDLLRHAGALLYGRTTFQLMESYWPDLVKNPSGNKSSDEFAVLIDDIPKILFSRTLKHVDWKNSTLKNNLLKEEIIQLKQQPGNPLFASSPSLIAQLTEMRLIDEYQLCFHPVIGGKGLPLFKNISEQTNLKLIRTKKFGSGAIVLYYDSIK